ncbi:unnamed protein product [Microthlaspi erraticum]|uniref:Uncharacterized protein n=1 Tax=Microthlaspi erraticum TaxID=1685480 RepID=A0A6D2JYA0_9BRAS|nr:unnamed protein product [Microthlaspi erraticum]
MARTKRGRKTQKKNPQVTVEVVEEQPELGDDRPVEEQPELGDDGPVEEQTELGGDGPLEDEQNKANMQSAQQVLDREEEEDHEGEIELSENDEAGAEPSRKRQRGPTRMKDIAKDPNNKLRVEFTFTGEPYGFGSVKLSSYLGPLVREHVPVTLTS